MPGPRVFGQAMGGGTRYQRQMGRTHSKRDDEAQSEEELLQQRRAEYRRLRQQQGEQIDESFGYVRFDHHQANETRRGWVFNMLATTVSYTENDTTSTGAERAGLDLYFRTESGSTFKSTVLYRPYFYVIPALSTDSDHSLLYEALISSLTRLYESNGLVQVQVVHKTDLDQVNHLSPRNVQGRPMLKLLFDNVQQLMDVRKRLQPTILKNQKRHAQAQLVFDISTTASSLPPDPMTTLVDMREYDVPYVVRVCTDLDLRAGAWYTVTPNPTDIGVTLSHPDVERKASPTYMAFDIECTKAPLKFPDANVDTIFMISYMCDGQGYLILSRDVVGQHVDDFEYTPKPSYPGPFHIFNEANEEALLKRFFAEYQRLKPQIVVTYNGDFFDWPFVEQRAEVYGLDIWTGLGVQKTGEGEYRGRCSVHLDAFHWVQRDSYLPQGAQGLKAVTKYKLGYDPVEVDPEDMVRYAQERPVHMATYSVSDAVATYYLYEKYVHMFIFSLCTIIPMGPEDVLRKGSGTLCEALLMVQACSKSIICPNKQVDPLAKFHNGHLLESETYIGGKVECLETGVYRSDVEYEFDLKATAFQMLIDNIDRDLTFAIEVEGGLDRSKIVNYDEVRCKIVEQLEMLRDKPKRVEKPYIYHLDVGAMYPNIILTNRLQPSAIVDDATCAACDFNQAKNGCKRRMDWVWRGDYTPATKSEYDRTKDQLSREAVQDGRPFHSLLEREQSEIVAGRLKTYARNAYKKTKVTSEETRTDTVCMRENDFYVETVRRFRDRRYELKKLTKKWKKRVDSATDTGGKKEAADRAIVYDSLQVAHKCILNSFYGYVMRKGARWRSMEMAGIVTKTGADLITQARILVEQIGRPLELDTDGIWCILPRSFPDVYNFKTSDGGKFKLEYPCIMLNADVHDNFTNHQYQMLMDPARGTYESRSECSIFFEVDGPYRCMVLPSSTEEGKLLKKRYAVFNFDGSLAELKGFELKRRGELELIKTFQSQVFERFLDGNSLEECYGSVADVANHWIDVLDTQGESLETDELVDLISENRNMSRQLEDYGDQKGTSQTTARRLGQFLGAEIIKDKGLNCKFIIAEQPYGAPVTERAIPTAIWKAEPSVMKHYLRKWLKSPGLEGEELDIRNVLDWDYYMDRLSKTIQKIITIPAALQKLPNPVPRVKHPDWLHSKVRQLTDRFKQQNITSMFELKEIPLGDIEDFGSGRQLAKRPVVHKASNRHRPNDNKTPQMPEKSRVELSKTNFLGWLEQKKDRWRTNRFDRKKRPRTSRNAGAFESGPSTKRAKQSARSMEGYMRDAARALTQREWQVVEVREMTSYDSNGSGSSSGDFLLWVMVGDDTLQKVQVKVPRTLYVTSRSEIMSSTSQITLKKVEKHLPHNKEAIITYEVTLPEHVFKTRKWTNSLVPAKAGDSDVGLESVYESETPLMLRALIHLGCVMRTGSSDSSSRKSFSLRDLRRVETPTEGEYLHRNLSYKRIFLYVSVNARAKTGIVAAFFMNTGSGKSVRSSKGQDDDDRTYLHDPTRPAASPKRSLEFSAACHVWVIKPGSNRSKQRNITSKSCERIFTQLVETIQTLAKQAEDAGQTTEYSCVSPRTTCDFSTLDFVDSEQDALSAANEAISAYSQGNNGPTFFLLNSSKPVKQLRKAVPSCNGFPVVTLPFPPGPAHNPSMITLPALNWEQPAMQLCMEAYFYMGAVSFPKRVMFARYGRVPMGNLGQDECIALYDIALSRQLVKSRSLLWASEAPGSPDLGVNFLPSAEGGEFPAGATTGMLANQNDLWGDDDELVSPVIRRPGSYRCVCAEIELHDLAIAALTDVASSLTAVFTNASGPHAEGTNPPSPNSVVMFEGGANDISLKTTAPLGDDMSTAVSLPLLRALVGSWLRDAFVSSNEVADEMLHHVYRLVASPDPLLNDPALHRVIHAMMKATFLRLLGELQRLGCSIVCASFNKVIVATNKSSLGEAEEYINFVVSTIQSQGHSGDGSVSGGGLERVAMRPSSFYAQFVFLDEYNFGGMYLERREPSESDEPDDVLREKSADGVTTHVVSSVISCWSLRNYLAGHIAQEYFRIIIGRFSKDLLRKQEKLRSEGRELMLSAETAESILQYKKKLVSKHFASYLTRAVGEIAKDGGGPESFPQLPGSRVAFTSPALEFVKSVVAVLELDGDVQNETHALKRSLLAQIGVAEYSAAAKWENPCARFILPDVFCAECNESRDVNLCDLPASDDEDSSTKRHWMCEDCGTAYNIDDIERRLIAIAERKMLRYQLQDLRCKKTNRVGTRALSMQSDCSAELKLDISRNDGLSTARVLYDLAKYHELEWLRETAEGIMGHFKRYE